MSGTKLILSSVLLARFVLPVQAELIPGRWDKVDQLPSGTAVGVFLKSGDLIEGRLTNLEDESLLVDVGAGSFRVPRNEVERVSVELEERAIPMKGALLGLAAGAAFGGVLAATDGSASFVSDPGGGGFAGGIRSGEKEWENKAAVIGGSAAVGCLFGFLMQTSRNGSKVRHETLYQAR